MASKRTDDRAYRERNDASHQQPSTMSYGSGWKSCSDDKRQQDGKVQEIPTVRGGVLNRYAIEQDTTGEGYEPPRDKAGRPEDSDPRDSPLANIDDLPAVPIEARGEAEDRAVLNPRAA